MTLKQAGAGSDRRPHRPRSRLRLAHVQYPASLTKEVINYSGTACKQLLEQHYSLCRHVRRQPR